MNENKDLWVRLEIEVPGPILVVQIFPEDEEEQHYQDLCPCNPEVTQIRDGFQVCHKAFDGRDVIDDAKFGVN